MLHRLFVVSILCVCSALIFTTANAQVIGQPYRINDKEVEKIIRRIEQQSDRFRSSLDSALDKSRFNGTRREDDINAFMKAFEEQTKHLHDRFKDHKSVAADVQAVLDRAAAIDGFMRRQRLSGRAEGEWATLRGNLDELAQAYNVTWRWEGLAAPTDLGPAGGQVAYPGDRGVLP